METKTKTNRKTVSNSLYRENRDIDLRGQCVQVALHIRKPVDTQDDLIRTADKLAAFVIHAKVPDQTAIPASDNNVVALKQ